MPDVAPTQERRHQPGPSPLWGESWYFDFSAPDGSIGGYVRLGLYPNLGVAWYWAALVGQGRRLVMVRDHELELPRGRDLEVRGQGIWSAVTCETPLDHWSIGLEAFAVALDDPADAYRGEWGDLVGLGFDLEWEATGTAFGPIGARGYGQACRISGEVLVGDERLDFDGLGLRGHAWGVQDWWAAPRCVASGVLEDGTAFAAGVGAGRPDTGYLQARGGNAGIEPVEISVVVGQADLPVSAALSVGNLSLMATVLAPAPLLLEAPDRRVARLARSWCRYLSADGRGGLGWAEWLGPPGSVPDDVVGTTQVIPPS